MVATRSSRQATGPTVATASSNGTSFSVSSSLSSVSSSSRVRGEQRSANNGVIRGEFNGVGLRMCLRSRVNSSTSSSNGSSTNSNSSSDNSSNISSNNSNNITSTISNRRNSNSNSNSNSRSSNNSSSNSNNSSTSKSSSTSNNNNNSNSSSDNSSSYSNNSNSTVSARRSSNSNVLTRKRRLIQEVEARLAIGVTPYWEGGVDEGGSEREDDGTPRRSRRGEARRRYEDAVGLIRERRKMAVNLPPMVSTREGKLLAVEVFGDDVLARLPAEDKGPRVGHCSSGYVCGHPVPRGKEGNRWCQTPVRASLESRMACTHHSHRRKGAGGPSKDQRRCMMLAVEFYDEAGDVCWQRVVSYLRSRAFPLERCRQRLVLTAGDRAVAVSDAKISLHGFAQCTFFWLAACRLTRRGYAFTMVAHASKAEFRDFLTELRANSAWPPPAQASSPFVCVNDRSRSSGSACYYSSGYEKVCLMF